MAENLPSYQEAIVTRDDSGTGTGHKKGNWIKRFVNKLFKKSESPPQPGLLVERKLLNPLFGYGASASGSGKKGFNPPRLTAENTQNYRNSLHLPHSGSPSNFENPLPSTSDSKSAITALTSQSQSLTRSHPVSHRASTSKSPFSFTSQTPSHPPTNYIRIKRSTSPIIGTWLIDTSLVVPKELLVPFKNKKEKRHHLHLWSEGERIDAGVVVVDSPNVGENGNQVLLTCSSEGRVSLRVAKPPQRTLSIFIRGSLINVKIPRSYRGTLKAHTASGAVFFSEGVSAVARSVYEKGKESRWFIGEMERSSGGVGGGTGKVEEIKEEDEEDGKYDVMKLKAKSRVGEKYGEVFVAYEDEEDCAPDF